MSKCVLSAVNQSDNDPLSAAVIRSWSYPRSQLSQHSEHFPSQKHTQIYCCFNVGPTLKEHWLNVCCLLEELIAYIDMFIYYFPLAYTVGRKCSCREYSMKFNSPLL